jgi:hypothetical protein
VAAVADAPEAGRRAKAEGGLSDEGEGPRKRVRKKKD